MSSQTPTASNKIRDPSFTYERRDNGTVLMKQVDDLPQHLPSVAHSLNKWHELLNASRGARLLSFSRTQAAHCSGLVTVEPYRRGQQQLLSCDD